MYNISGAEMQYGIIDTHAHYDDSDFDADRDLLLKQAGSSIVRKIINIGDTPASCRSTLELSRRYENVYAAIGVHPEETAGLSEEVFAELSDMAAKNSILTGRGRVVAVGEIGLDYHEDTVPRETQKKWFIRQMELAERLSLPVSIHSRDAAEDTLTVVRKFAGRVTGVIHCFSYSAEQAALYDSMGYAVGIGGVVTFKNARKIKEVAASVPDRQLVLETDSPYIAPEPHRGTRNTSWNLPLVADEIAKLRGISSEEVMRITADNAVRIFRLDMD